MTNRKRCAIYTRKSTEDGLEQEFNSLDAQREACSAYITSQASEGWEEQSELYDDGGFSGGKMERPALQRLLEEVKSGKVDIIVVYKVDRLTRSLADFAKIVEILDEHEASFVSVTQSFNTTNSMGRLTLNVLLSFAQFEREVTGERIRDKIAASKKKGIWMGGNIPMGYDVIDRKLIIVEHDAQTVRHIFRRYLALRSVPALKQELDQAGIRSPKRVSRVGTELGGRPLTPGAIYHILQNHIYVGKIVHQDKAYPGEHQAIIDDDLFEQVQSQLQSNRVSRRNGEHVDAPSLMPGIVFDGLGRPMTPTKTIRSGRCYRYYASRCETEEAKKHPVWRVPAADLEEIVVGKLCNFLGDQSILQSRVQEPNLGDLRMLFTEAKTCSDELISAEPHGQRKLLLRWITKVIVGSDTVEFSIDLTAVLPSSIPDNSEKQSITLSTPASIFRNGKQTRLAIPPSSGDHVRHKDTPLIKLVAKAWAARCAIEGSNNDPKDVAAEEGYEADYFARLVRLGYLAPDIVSAIIDGKQPANLTRQKLARIGSLPIRWDEQRALLGFIPAASPN